MRLLGSSEHKMRFRLKRTWYVMFMVATGSICTVIFLLTEVRVENELVVSPRQQKGHLAQVGMSGSTDADRNKVTLTPAHANQILAPRAKEDRQADGGRKVDGFVHDPAVEGSQDLNDTEPMEREPIPPSLSRSFSFLSRLGLNPGQLSNSTEVSQEPYEIRPSLEASRRPKTILLWTWLYSKPDWVFGLGRDPFLKHCPRYNNCRTTLDHSEHHSADAIMFFVFAMTTVLNKTERLSEVLPPRGKRDQVYIFWNDEPPRPAFGPFGTLKGLQGVFNITVTYRSDSTITLPIFKSERRFAPSEPLNTTAIMAAKTHLASWVVSACGKSHSYRFEYVEALQEYIDVDVYGKCGNFTCIGEGFKCFEHLQQFYKFYFAFENSYCKDYMTEKPFRTLQGNWVPVVLGGGNYTERLPPHSFIDVRDFKSPKHLAEYLMYLDTHDDEYLEYLRYKPYYRTNRRQTKTAFCKICEILNRNDPTLYEHDLDPHAWWETSGCIKKYYVPRTIHLTDK